MQDGEAVAACAAEVGIPISGAARDTLAAYARLLLTWGERINLTAAKTVREVARDHLPDSFAIARRLVEAGGAAERVIDVGSGGGLPALPLALLRPESSFLLVEATAKKVAFLRTAVRAMGLGARVEVKHGRAGRSIATELGDRGLFEVAMSRATLPPAEWLSLAEHLVLPGGRVFCLSSHAIGVWPPGLEWVGQTRYREDRWVAELKRST